MADKNEEFVVGGGGGSFSQLLFSNEDNEMDDNNLKFSSLSASKTPKMLCFGNYLEEEEDKDRVFCYQTVRTVQKSTVGVTCSDSSSASSSCNTNNNNNNIKSPSISNKKRNGSCKEPAKTSQPIGIGTPPVESQGNCKKSKNENPTSTTGRAKVRKEKLGERITALQQLVSPFGKTDTASVLHEAMGYIRFLHEQVQVLCSPYLQRLPSSSSSANLHHGHGGDCKQLPPIGGEKGEDESRKGLKSRGLCLVPVACTTLVANSNGADFWSPAMANNNNSSGNNSSISKS